MNRGVVNHAMVVAVDSDGTVWEVVKGEPCNSFCVTAKSRRARR